MSRTALIVPAVLALAGIAGGCLHDRNTAAAEPLPLVLDEVSAEAGRLQNRLLSARHLADMGAGAGLQPAWKPVSPWTESSLLALPSAPVRRIVVYVHGYNTPLAESISNGNLLLRRLTALDSEADGIAFFTFCWRGDFGSLRFGAAEAAATSAGASLAGFLRTISDAPFAGASPRILVLAHSLGSRVALVAAKAMWDESPRTRLDHLVMVQPAVPRGFLYVGSVDTFLAPLRSRDRDGGLPVHVSRHEHRGPYLDSLRVARHVTITRSSSDNVLNGAYRTARHDYASATGYRRFPNLDEPLGLPRLPGDDPSPDYREIVLTDDLPALARSHSGLYQTDDVIRLVWQGVLAADTERSRTVPPEPREESNAMPVPPPASSAPPPQMEQLKMLFDYTKFHIGIYLTLTSALLTLLNTEFGKTLSLRPSLIWSAIGLITIAGAAGGVVASNVPSFTSLSEFSSAQLGPFGLDLMTGNQWIRVEHGAFWAALLVMLAAFAFGQRGGAQRVNFGRRRR